MNIKRVCVYCASSRNCDDYYNKEADKLGRMLARNSIEIIYGGGNLGLMKHLADGAMAEGGKVVGIIPKFLYNLELGHSGISELREVPNMHIRKKTMLEESDCIIALPGGCGTIEELMEAITWKQLGLIISPIIIVNLKNYYDNLIKMLEHSIEEKFMRKEYRDLWTVVSSVDEAIGYIANDLKFNLTTTFT